MAYRRRREQQKVRVGKRSGLPTPPSPDVRCGHPGLLSLGGVCAFAIHGSAGHLRRFLGRGQPLQAAMSVVSAIPNAFWNIASAVGTVAGLIAKPRVPEPKA